MSVDRTFATARRVLTELRHDPPTLALIFFLPCVLLTLMHFVYNNQTALLYRIQPLMLGIFPLTIMFLVTSITTLHERTTGTLDRLMTMPTSRLDFVLGYALAFMLLALIEASLACGLIVLVFAVPVAGGAWLLLVGAVLNAFLGTALGLLVSAFARTEFQAVQFLPLIIFPQFLLCGLLVPREHMASVLYRASDFLPMSYSVDAMRHITTETSLSMPVAHDFLVVAACTLVVLVLGALTIRRRA